LLSVAEDAGGIDAIEAKAFRKNWVLNALERMAYLYDKNATQKVLET
jgi:hypothetical protein